ncbi:MAG TPA: hypothetical protein VGK67_25370 [Myxococcales bacterium]|jgi:hypothetical protein
MAPKETILFVIALTMPIFALAMLFNNVRGGYGNLLGVGPNLAERRLIEQRRLQATGSISDKPPPLLDLSFVSTGSWAGKAGPAAAEPEAVEVRVAAPGAKAPATSASAAKGKAAARDEAAAAEKAAASSAAARKALFEVEAGSTLASRASVAVATIDASAARTRTCAGAQGPCECSGARGAAGAGVMGLLGGGAEDGESGSKAARCTCGAGAAPKTEDDPAYLALGMGDRFFEGEAAKEIVQPPRKKLQEALARAPLGMWRRLEPPAKGVKRWELLKTGDYVLARQTSRVSTDYDGSALPPKGLWDDRYKPETAFKLVNKDPARTAATLKDPGTKKRLEWALASADSRAWDLNKRELYAEIKVEVGAQVSLSSRDRYVVVNRVLDEAVAKEFGLKWGVEAGQHRPSLGGTALVSDPRSGLMQVAVVADQVPRDACGQVSAGLREVFADTLKIGGAMEDRRDALDTLYVIHDPAKGGSPFSDTGQLAALEEIADRQATDILPALSDQIAAWVKSPPAGEKEK